MQTSVTYAWDRLIDGLLPAVLEAGRLELSYFANGVKTERKEDKSPVTIADREAEQILLAGLQSVAPEIPVIAEEAVSAGIVPRVGRRAFFVDALDGTRKFIKGNPEFSINIGMIEDQLPVFGLIYVPKFSELYVTRAIDVSVRVVLEAHAPVAPISALAGTRLAGRAPDRRNLVAFNSLSTQGASAEFLSRLGVHERRPLGSSIKFCRIAEGAGDLYARFGDTCEWDTAAGHAILAAAGGSVTETDGTPLIYRHNAPRFLNPHFIAWGRAPLVP